MGHLKFEAALSRLETLVHSLEKGDLSLEASLKVFEEGVKLSKACLKLLNEAEKKVTLLMENKEIPFTDGSEASPLEDADESSLEDSVESDMEEDEENTK